jgi:hypothetical protein
VSEYDWAHDAQRVAEGPQVVGTLLEGPRIEAPPVGPAVSAQIDVDDLRVNGEPAELRLE